MVRYDNNGRRIRRDLRYNPAKVAGRRIRKWATTLKFNPDFMEKNGDDETYIKALRMKERIERRHDEREKRGRKPYLDHTSEAQLSGEQLQDGYD